MLRSACLALLLFPAFAWAEDPIRDRFVQFGADGELAGAVMIIGTKEKIAYEKSASIVTTVERKQLQSFRRLVRSHFYNEDFECRHECSRDSRSGFFAAPLCIMTPLVKSFNRARTKPHRQRF